MSIKSRIVKGSNRVLSLGEALLHTDNLTVSVTIHVDQFTGDPARELWEAKLTNDDSDDVDEIVSIAFGDTTTEALHNLAADLRVQVEDKLASIDEDAERYSNALDLDDELKNAEAE